MSVYRVKIKCGKPGEFKHDSHDVTVECDDESVAADLAINKFKNSNGANRNNECDVEKIVKLK